MTVGFVTDMLELLFVRFAIFNVADCWVCLGAGLLMLSLWLRPEEWERKRDAKAV